MRQMAVDRIRKALTLSALSLAFFMTACNGSSDALRGHWMVNLERTVTANYDTLSPLSRVGLPKVARHLDGLEVHFASDGRVRIKRDGHETVERFGILNEKSKFIHLWVTDAGTRETLAARIEENTLWLLQGGDLIALDRK